MKININDVKYIISISILKIALIIKLGFFFIKFRFFFGFSLRKFYKNRLLICELVIEGE